MIHVPPRLFVILAREAPVGVVFRRGPSRWTRLVRWETGRDRFEAGPWGRIHVYPRRSDLSPDGRKLVYFATDYSRTPPAWTAVSVPPRWEGERVWAQEDAWGGGGWFEGGKCVLNPHSGEDYPIFERRLVRDGWEAKGEWQTVHRLTGVRVFEKAHPRGRWVLRMRAFVDVGERKQGRGCSYEEYEVIRPGDGARVDLAGAECAEWDHGGRLVFAREGKLFARGMGKGPGEAVELYDANGERPPGRVRGATGAGAGE